MIVVAVEPTKESLLVTVTTSVEVLVLVIYLNTPIEDGAGRIKEAAEEGAMIDNPVLDNVPEVLVSIALDAIDIDVKVPGFGTELPIVVLSIVIPPGFSAAVLTPVRASVCVL